MKIRNHRKKEWWFFPHKESKLYKQKLHRFKYKSDLMSFLNKNFKESINGEVRLEENSFGHSGCIRTWFVWYNDYDEKGKKLEIELRQETFRGRKFVFKQEKIRKSSKKYFAFSDKVSSLMANIYQDEKSKTILPKDAKRLVELFYKRGFKDFEPTKDDWEYIDGNISDGIQFSYWSDRCSWLRTKTIIEFFKREKLI